MKSSFVRNGVIAVFIVVCHVLALWALVLTSTDIKPPEVVTVSLLGSLIAPPAAAAQPASAPTALSEQQAVPEPESAPAEPSPPPEPVVETPAPRPQPRMPPPPRPRPERPRPTPPAPRPEPRPAPAPVQQAPQVNNSTPSAESVPAAGASNTTAAAPVAQGRPDGAQDAVTAPSSRASYLNNPKPPYPQASRRMMEQGRVILRGLVSAQGTAKQVEVKTSSGYPRLDQSAQNTVKNWRFVPAKRGDTPIDMWYDVPIDFSLNR